jgi:hypothetical protein
MLVGLCVFSAQAANSDASGVFAGQDLHFNADKLTTYQVDPLVAGDHVLYFDGAFSMSIGSNQLTSDSAIVWLKTISDEHRGTKTVDYNAQVYLEGNVSMVKGKLSRTTDIGQLIVDQGQVMITRFLVSGEIYATAQTREEGIFGELKTLDIYRKALLSVIPVDSEPSITSEAVVPQYGGDVTFPRSKDISAGVANIFDPGTARTTNAATETVEEAGAEVNEFEPGRAIDFEPGKASKKKQPTLQYPVSIAALGDSSPKIEKTEMGDGEFVATIIGRFYLWQKQNDQGDIIEFQADNAVIFYSSGQLETGKQTSSQDTLASGMINSVYLTGNIVMTESGRTVKAGQLFYDFENKRALAIEAEMRQFDTVRNIPVYVRAEKLKKLSDSIFQADNVTLTSSEFYLPQLSLNASKMLLTDTTSLQAREGGPVKDSNYDAIIEDISLKAGTTTFFRWPKIRADFERPDLPIKRVAVGDDSDYGFSVETRWYLARLLGKKEPEGVDSTFALDYFGDRGVGAGVEIDYKKDDYFGSVLGYAMQYRGTEDLGRTSSRENIDPGQDIRGRFTFRHRHYLPYDWQATIETSYISDKSFLEWFYRSEFNTGKSQETLLHLKRIRDNWGFTFLTKVRINDFQTQTEELPTVGFHLKGQSFWDNRMTFYSDTTVSRLRNRFGNQSDLTGSEQFYSFVTTRNEIDLPLCIGTFKVVPFVAGSYSLEDQGGYAVDIDSNPSDRQTPVWLGEAGIRASTMFYRTDETVKSDFWDINGIRHIVKPHAEAVFYNESDDVYAMRDAINFGVSQRWQTHRGTADKLRSLDWMRLDVDATFVNNDRDITNAAPSRFIWNDPTIPALVRRKAVEYGSWRDSVTADYSWRISDTTTVLGDIYYDIDSGKVDQFDIGFARYIYPDISYYLGNRYLRNVEINIPDDNVHEKGSSSLVGSIAYALSPKYTVMFATEYNLDYGQSVRTEVTLLRRYHRMYYGLTFSDDQSRDRRSVMVSIWPEGVKELALSGGRYAGMVENSQED